MKSIVVVYLILVIGIFMFSGCGPEPLENIAVYPQEQTLASEQEETTPISVPEVPETTTPEVVTNMHSGGGGGGSSAPQPECTLDAQCGEGFECVEQHCVALPECREDISCENPNDFCAEDNTCQPKPCTEDSECTEPAFCLVDRDFTGEGEPPTVCREKSCPVVGETTDPNSVIVPEECTEENTTNVFNLLQNTIHPDLSVLSEAIKVCELEEELAVLETRFTDLDNVRIELDNFLAGCNT